MTLLCINIMNFYAQSLITCGDKAEQHPFVSPGFCNVGLEVY